MRNDKREVPSTLLRKRVFSDKRENNPANETSPTKESSSKNNSAKNNAARKIRSVSVGECDNATYPCRHKVRIDYENHKTKPIKKSKTVIKSGDRIVPYLEHVKEEDQKEHIKKLKDHMLFFPSASESDETEESLSHDFKK